MTASIIHNLLDNDTLKKDQALEAVDSATQAEEDSADAKKGPVRTLHKSLNLLSSVLLSIEAHTGRYDQAIQAGLQDDQWR